MNAISKRARSRTDITSGPRNGASLLLVCRDPGWARAVRDAAHDRNVDACDARGAVSRLSCITPGYSHLLLQPQSDDGLFDTLLQLTTEAEGSGTTLLLLGGHKTSRPGLNVIHSATPRSVYEALMVAPRSRKKAAPPVKLAEIKAALDAGMISARYQPIVRLSDRRVVALEVLARLDHPDEGTILPDRFIPQIEDAGLAAQLTELITQRALTELGALTSPDRPLIVTLNFPLDVILRDDTIDRLEAQRRAAGIPAALIAIELTESMPVQDFSTLRAVLERLRAIGYRTAIDDVSPTMAGLAELLTLPFTTLKLDKDLVTLAGNDPAMLAFLRATTDHAHQVGMQVVAEGIETAAAWNLMRAARVDGVQGYLLARPLPAAAVPVWLYAWERNPGVD